MKISLRIDINKAIEFELGWPGWIRRGHRTSVLVAGVAAAIFLVSTVYVIAHHLPFTDVPTSGPLHDAVGAIYGARITVGTSPTTYSPEDPVTRSQMAFFLQRSLGRAGYSISSSDARLSEVPSELATVTIKAGEMPGGVGFIKVDANYSVYSRTPRSARAMERSSWFWIVTTVAREFAASRSTLGIPMGTRRSGLLPGSCRSLRAHRIPCI